MPKETREITYAEAICEATRLCLDQDASVYIMGEGVADPGAIFETTRGLVGEFGPDRVIEMPTSESGMTGIAVGSAIMGQRPIMTHQRVEFALLAFENIVNTAAKMRYATAGKMFVPMVIRLIIGRGWGQGPSHAQSLESLFAHFPGLKVVMPTTPYDAKGMMTAAIRDNDPTIFLEHRWLHSTYGVVPKEDYEVPLKEPRIVRNGSDLTIVATSHMVLEAMVVADALNKADASTEIIDLRVIRPLNTAPIIESVKQTGRLLCLDMGWTSFGVASEIITQVVESGFHDFKAPPRRLGMADHPSPSTRALIPNYYPFPEKILEESLRLLDLPAGKAGIAKSELQKTQKERLVDVPDKSFSGPF